MSSPAIRKDQFCSGRICWLSCLVNYRLQEEKEGERERVKEERGGREGGMKEEEERKERE